MTKSASVVVVGVVAALAIVWFWFRWREVTTYSPPETDARETDVPATETAGVVPSVATVEDEATGPHDSPVATQDERGASEAKKISDAYARGVTPTFVNYLTSKGASREDSERIVAEAMREMAPCVLDAMRTDGFAPPPPPEVNAGNPPVAVSGLLFSDRVRSCLTGVHERIGVPPAVRYELRMQGETFEMGEVLPE